MPHRPFFWIALPLLVVISTGIAQAQLDARVQAIHNAADPELAVIDFYVGDKLILDDVTFRSASPYLDVPGFIPLTGGIAPGNSTSSDDVFFEFMFTLTPNETYQFILVGVRDPGLFEPNPDGRDISLDVLVNEEAREAGSDPSMLDVNVVHGVTDVASTDVEWAQVIADDVLYGDFSSYAMISPSGPVLVTPPVPGTIGYEPPLFDPGDAMTLLLSGFENPSSNQSGPPYTVFAVYADGTSVELLPITVSAEPEGVASGFTLHGNYPNPFNPSTTITFDLDAPGTVSVELFDVFGRKVMTTDPTVYSSGVGHAIQLDASALPPGSYIYRMRAETGGSIETQTGRMSLVR